VEAFDEITLADIVAHDGTAPATYRFATQGYATGAADVLGANLVTNGDFPSATTGWSPDANTTLSVSSGRLRITLASGSNPRAMQTLTGLIPGRTYRITANVYRGTVGAGNAIALRVSTSSTLAVNTPFEQAATAGDLTVSGTFTATASTMYVGAVATESVAARYLELDNVTLSEITFPAHTFYDGRIEQPGNIQRNIFNNRSTFGQTQVGYGELTLVNIDGALDGLKDYGFAGFNITIRRGVMPANESGLVWQTVMSGVMETADFSWSAVSIKIRDRQQDLAKPLQANRYGGTNVLPNGLDGVSTDLQGKCKPLLYGRAFNFSPPCVNTTRQIYQISDILIQSVDAVLDRGVALTAGAAYSSQADMETNAPSSGQYRVWISAAGSYIRLGSTPVGILTVDATHGAAAGNRTAAQLMSQVLHRAGIAPNDISAADIAALDADAPYQVGYWLGHSGEMTGIEMMDKLSNSAGAWWGADRNGTFRMAQVKSPDSGSSIGTLTTTDIVKVDRVRSTDQGSGVPAYRVKLNYLQYQEVINDLGASVPATVKSERAERFRQVVASDSAVMTQWPKAVEIEFDTYIALKADADTEVARRFLLYKVVRDTLPVQVHMDSPLAALIDLGKVITVQLPRFNYSAGKKFLITGIRTNQQNNLFDLTLWG